MKFKLVCVCLILLSTKALGQLELISDINFGEESSYPTELIVYEETLVFRANDGLSGESLWGYDGMNTFLIEDIFRPTEFQLYDDKLYFQAYFSSWVGHELCSYNGSTVQLEADLNLSNSSAPHDLTVFNSLLYFGTSGPNERKELWRFDGDTAQLVANLGPIESLLPNHLTVFNDKLFFVGQDSLHGIELWSFNGDTVEMVEDINLGINHSGPSNLVVYDDKLFFFANSDSFGRELYSYDGSQVELIADLRAGDEGSNPNFLVVYDNQLFFSANDSIHGNELWSYDGSEVVLVQDILEGSNSSFPLYLSVVDDKLYFNAYTYDVGRELFSYNGAAINLEADVNIGSGGSIPRYITEFEDKVYFQAFTPSNGYELWGHNSQVGIMDVNQTVSWKVYPNPTKAQVRVEFTKMINNSNVYVFCPLGSLIHAEHLKTTNHFEYELPEPKGIYIIQLINEDGTVQNHKVVKE